MFSVLVIRLRSLRLLRVSGIVMRLRMFLLLITFLKASHSRSEERFSRNAETEIYTLSLHDALPICSGDSSKKFKIAEGQWYRYAPSYVSPAYHLLEGFPFIQEPPSGDLQERVL